MSVPGTLRSMVPPDRRDWALVMVGAFSLFVAYAYGVASVPHTSRNALSTATTLVPLRVFAAAWAITGVYCAVAAFTERRIGGYKVAGFMPTAWGTVYLACWLLGDPGRGWVVTGLFWSYAALVTLTAGLVDPRTPRERAGR